MKNIYKISILTLFLAGFIAVGLFFAPKSIHADVSCSYGAGNINFSVTPRTLKPGGQVNLKATFNWPNGAPADCILKEMRIVIYAHDLSPANVSENLVMFSNIGTVSAGKQYTATWPLGHEEIKDGWLNDNKLTLFAIATENKVLSFTRYAESGGVTIDYYKTVTKRFACIASNGKYACSPGNLSNCSDVVACQGKTCILLDDDTKCGQTAPAPTPTLTPSSGAGAGGGGGGGGTGGGTTTQKFELPNPIGITNFQDLVNIIGKWIFNLAIPIAVIIIIYAGVLMLTSGGNPGRFQTGAKALWYAVLGLAVVLIGKGFVTLVKSILSLKK